MRSRGENVERHKRWITPNPKGPRPSEARYTVYVETPDGGSKLVWADEVDKYGKAKEKSKKKAKDRDETKSKSKSKSKEKIKEKDSGKKARSSKSKSRSPARKSKKAVADSVVDIAGIDTDTAEDSG